VLQHLGIGFFVHQAIRSAVRRVDLVSMSYIIVRGGWCNIVLNMCTPSIKVMIQRIAFMRNSLPKVSCENYSRRF